MPTTTKLKPTSKNGKIIQIVGVVIDIEFPGKLPAIYNALEVKLGGKTLVMEVAQHLSKNAVRAVAMGPTDGLSRGASVADTGAPIVVPVGDATLGRMFNVVGEPIDDKPAPKAKLAPIPAEAPSLEEQSGQTEVFETGIKVIVLICLFVFGGFVGFFGGV